MTGSGKTYTMFGDNFENKEAALDSGIVSESIKFILQDKANIKVRMSYLEIYNESIRDLLNPLSQDSLSVLEDAKKGVYCPLLCEKEILNLEQI